MIPAIRGVLDAAEISNTPLIQSGDISKDNTAQETQEYVRQTMERSGSRSSDPVREAEFNARKGDLSDSIPTPHDRRAERTPMQSSALEYRRSAK